MSTSSTEHTPHDRLTHSTASNHIDGVVNDMEHLMEHAGEVAENQCQQTGKKFKQVWYTAHEKFPDIKEKAIHHTKHVAHVTDEYVDSHPWKAVSVAAFVGLLIGVLIGRGR